MSAPSTVLCHKKRQPWSTLFPGYFTTPDFYLPVSSDHAKSQHRQSSETHHTTGYLQSRGPGQCDVKKDVNLKREARPLELNFRNPTAVLFLGKSVTLE